MLKSMDSLLGLIRTPNFSSPLNSQLSFQAKHQIVIFTWVVNFHSLNRYCVSGNVTKTALDAVVNIKAE